MLFCSCHLKATHFYCFAHKVPVCSECMLSEEHQICEVRKYSGSIVKESYNGPPPNCAICKEVMHDMDESVRLVCQHDVHKSCLALQSYPPRIEPATYSCPSCSSVDAAAANSTKSPNSSRSHGTVAMSTSKLTHAPLPLLNQKIAIEVSDDPANHHEVKSARRNSGDMEAPKTAVHFNGTEALYNMAAATQMSPRFSDAVTASSPKLSRILSRKNSFRADRKLASVTSKPTDDDDTEANKYNRRSGMQRSRYFYALLPFWSRAKLGSLRGASPKFKDNGELLNIDHTIDGRRRRVKLFMATVDPRNVLLFFASISCVGTMILLYFTISVYQTEKC